MVSVDEQLNKLIMAWSTDKLTQYVIILAYGGLLYENDFHFIGFYRI